MADQNAPTRHMVAVGRPMVSRERGAVERTDRPLDLTLQEEGYLVAEGPEGRVLLRSASTYLDPDGSLRDPSGRRIMFAGGEGHVDPELPVSIDVDGRILQQGREMARLLVVDVVDPRGLSPTGAGAYRQTAESGQVFPISGRVVSGALEKSNVNPVANLVRMISLEREYQSLTRAIHAYREADDGVLRAGSSK